jgi:hypothetical protein
MGQSRRYRREQDLYDHERVLFVAIVTLSDFTEIYKSKTTSVAMAPPDTPVDGNACVSSTEGDIYAAAKSPQTLHDDLRHRNASIDGLDGGVDLE